MMPVPVCYGKQLCLKMVSLALGEADGITGVRAVEKSTESILKKIMVTANLHRSDRCPTYRDKIRTGAPLPLLNPASLLKDSVLENLQLAGLHYDIRRLGICTRREWDTYQLLT